jgi:predicted dehydrogenase
VDPATRDVSDVAHKIAAVGSRSVASAQAFLDKLRAAPGDSSWGVAHGGLDGAGAYGSYEEVYADPAVDVVYVGTPHPFHHQNAKAALLAGKHVLCEKPFVMDLAELDELIAIAREKNVFLMEAVWTRFQPIAYAVQEVIRSGRLGAPRRVTAELSSFAHIDERADDDRMIDPKLGGGALLDLAPYPAVWSMLVLHQHPSNTDKAPQVLDFSQRIYKRNGVDEMSALTVRWEGLAESRMLNDFTAWTPRDNACVVDCDKAQLIIDHPLYRPERFRIVPHPQTVAGSSESEKPAAKADDITEESEHRFPIPAGNGMHYEADHVARCLRDGKLESERMPLAESRVVQGWLDTVRKGGSSVLKDWPHTAGK